jgi:hypothetical protein
MPPHVGTHSSIGGGMGIGGGQIGGDISMGGQIILLFSNGQFFVFSEKQIS